MGDQIEALLRPGGDQHIVHLRAEPGGGEAAELVVALGRLVLGTVTPAPPAASRARSAAGGSARREAVGGGQPAGERQYAGSSTRRRRSQMTDDIAPATTRAGVPSRPSNPNGAAAGSAGRSCLIAGPTFLVGVRFQMGTMRRDRRTDLAEFLASADRQSHLATSDFPPQSAPDRRPAAGRSRDAGRRLDQLVHVARAGPPDQRRMTYSMRSHGRCVSMRSSTTTLIALATRPAGRDLPPAGLTVPIGITSLLAALEPAPAYVLGPRWDVRAWGRAQARLYPRSTNSAPMRTSLVWVMFAEPTIRTLLGDWEAEARQVLSLIRADTTPYREDREIVTLVERLTETSPEFAA